MAKEVPTDYPLSRFHRSLNIHYDVDLKDHLSKFLRQKPSVFSPSFFYSLKISKGHGSHLIAGDNRLYRDADYTFVLVKRFSRLFFWERYLACIGFDADEKKKRVIVRQIQGSRGVQKELKKLRWEKLLLAVLIDWAKANGFKYIHVQPAKKNKWVPTVKIDKMTDSEKEWFQRFYLKYDVTARRMGFRYNGKFKTYVLNLN